MHINLPAASLMSGTDIGSGISIDKVKELDQGVRNRVSTELLQLTLRELFDFRFMQASSIRTRVLQFTTEKIHDFLLLATGFMWLLLILYETSATLFFSLH
jgi:hypothetical protein